MDHPNQYFKQENGAFKLDAVLSVSTLSIKLLDLQSFVLYESKYTDQNIGKEINRRCDLKDLFVSLTQTIHRADGPENLKVEEVTPFEKKNEVRMGDVIKLGETPCYQVEKGGIITIFVYFFDKRTRQDISLTSRLQLQKVKALNGEEISKEISDRKSRETEKNMKTEIRSLKIENVRISQQIKEIKQVLQKAGLFVDNKNDASLQSLEQTTRPDSCFRQRSMYLLTALPQPYLAKFKITGNLIEYIGQNSAWTQIVFNEYIPFSSSYVFRVKILRFTPSKNIMIGVIDYPKQKDARYSYNSKNVVTHYSGSGKGYKFSPTHNQGQEGEGFDQGDTVEMRVDLKDKRISWSSGKKERVSMIEQILGDKTRTFIPYLQFFTTGDIVELLN